MYIGEDTKYRIVSYPIKLVDGKIATFSTSLALSKSELNIIELKVDIKNSLGDTVFTKSIRLIDVESVRSGKAIPPTYETLKGK